MFLKIVEKKWQGEVYINIDQICSFDEHGVRLHDGSVVYWTEDSYERCASLIEAYRIY